MGRIAEVCREVRRQRLARGRFVLEPRAAQDLLREVVGDALAPPERCRAYRMLVVEWPERSRTQALHVPEVEVLVRGDARVVLWIAREGRARRADGGAVEVLEPTARAVDVEERVLAIGQRADDAGGRLHDTTHHVDEARGVERRRVGARP